MRTAAWVGYLSLFACFFSFYVFWDHWKAIYPCVARLIFGERCSFFVRFSHMLFDIRFLLSI